MLSNIQLRSLGVVPARLWVPSAAGERAGREAAGKSRRKTVLRAEQQGADLLPGVRPLVHSVSRLFVGRTPRPDPPRSPSSARHCPGCLPPNHSEGGNYRKRRFPPPPRALDALRRHWRPQHLLLAKDHTISEKSHRGQ